MFVDSHCHLEMEDYDKDRQSVIDRGVKEGVSYMLTVGTEERYFSRVAQIVDSNPTVFGAIGIHPHNAKDYSPALEESIRKHLAHPKIVGYGEIGLDFFRNHSPREAQLEAFRRQIGLAREAGLPIIIHSRNAKRETLEVLEEAGLGDHKTVIHCYSYDLATAKKLLGMGRFYLSIPGTVTYKNTGLTDIVRHVPLDRLLSETDAPFLTPEPKRGRRNEPAYVRLVVETIARIKQQPVEEVASALAATFSDIFLDKGRK
ncbi:MAG: putative deoxyribonuclease YcfH [Syntrophorhabdaceae bacterium PtaU1.Bin034]|nr:MAG: putative deoxyribonuclease YcfH [Syntrophorhabdaceae bacterium PtaU1.Bin034]